ncbi:bifunctional DNA primase/polymerase [Streptomyces sp. NBC_01518]|uniref:bifunctional DNA primase/polymerase n=1 Tax=Streptomyces sp. NBC_01518 TaxID=2903891 RepID=UPI0038635A44
METQALAPQQSAAYVDSSEQPFAHAQQLYSSSGWPVLVLPRLKKCDPPYGFTGKYDQVAGEKEFKRWLDTNPHDPACFGPLANIGIRMPRGVIGIDVDQYGNKRGAEQLAELIARNGPLPDTFRSTRRGPENPSGIRLFRVPESWVGRGKAAVDIDVIQHHHRYAVAWPSVVPEFKDGTGALFQYAWYDLSVAECAPPHIGDLPFLPQPWQDDVSVKNRDFKMAGSEYRPDAFSARAQPGQWLAHRLELPSGDGFRSSNDWNNEIAWGKARTPISEDELIEWVKAQDAESENPYFKHDPVQFIKTVRSARSSRFEEWEGHRAVLAANEIKTKKKAVSVAPPALLVVPEQPIEPPAQVVTTTAEFTAVTGWMAVRDNAWVVKHRYQESGKDCVAYPAVTDFHLVPKYEVVQENRRYWVVDVVRVDGATLPDRKIDSDTLANPLALNKWVMGQGGTFTPKNQSREQFITGTNILKYLRGCGVPESREVDHLGWYPEHRVFLTGQGFIRPGIAQVEAFNEIRPSDFAVENSRARYGTEVSSDEAVTVFKEVLTFHDETVASVMGSWLVMVVLRGHFQSSVFPTLQFDAHSESSKSNFVRMMLQLIGVDLSGGGWTRATAEDAYSSHANGVVWFDDAKIDEDLQEVIRQAATGGEKSKKRTDDFSRNRLVKFRAATVITSEGMTDRFNSQKANRDRAIQLELPKVTDRMSLHDPTRIQWEDVKALWFKRFTGDFTKVAGSLVAAILAHSDDLDELTGARRVEQSYSILRAGSRVLSRLTNDPDHSARVDKWVSAQDDLGNASSVVLEVIPALWRDRGFPTAGTGKGHVVPVFRDGSDGPFWVNSARLADAWREWNRGHRDSRTESLTDQKGVETELKAIGCGAGKSKRTGVPGEAVVRYREIPSKYTELITKTALGDR